MFRIPPPENRRSSKMKGKTIRAGAVCMALFASGAVLAQQNISVAVNGQPVSFGGARPAMIGGRVLVPLRGVMEQLGANVTWDGATRSVMANKSGTDLSLRI